MLARHVRRGERWLATGTLGGAVAAAIGLTCLVGFDLILSLDAKDLTAASAQTLNMLENDFFLPVVLGFALFGILGGLTVVAGRILPRWMGWVLFAAGIVALVPPIAWFAMLAVGAQPQATPTQARRKPRSPTASVLSMNWSTAPVSGSRPTAGSVIASRSAAVKRPAAMTW